MGNNKEKEEKQKKKSKWLKVVLIILIVLFLISLVGIFIILYLTDNNKNTYVKKDETYNEIIVKDFVNGFKDTSTTGNFNFALEEDDVNELLINSLESINDKNVKSIYYKKPENAHHIFYVDLNLPVINSRVVVNTIANVNDDYTISLSIESCSIGKLDAFNLLSSEGYLSSEFINKVAIGSKLPITYNSDIKSFIFTPLSFIDDFPFENNPYLKSIFDVIKLDHSLININPNDLGFMVDFSKLRNINHIDRPLISGELIDISNEFLDNLTSFDFDSLPAGEEKIIYSLSLDELNKFIRKGLDDFNLDNNLKEVVHSSLINESSSFYISDLHFEIVDSNKIDIVIGLNLNGYVVDVNVLDSIFSDENNFTLTIVNGKKIKIGDNTFVDSSQITNLYINFLDKVYSKINYTYLIGNESNSSLTIDLSNEMNVSSPDIYFYEVIVRINPSFSIIEFVIRN